MSPSRIKPLALTLLSLFALLASLSSPLSFAQDADANRYRPQGRELARAVGNEFGERLFEVRIYDPEPDVAEFSNATIFYPLTLSFAPPFGAVIFVPGYRASQDIYDWWGPMLASLGFAVMILDTNEPNDALEARKNALIAAVEFLHNENTESDSPIQGKIDTSKIAIMGHSMGGGGSLHAAQQLGDAVKAVIPLSPYCCEPGQSFEGDFSSLNVPTLIFASAEDQIAPPEQHARMLYQSISSSTAKAYLEFATGDHNIATNGGPDLATLGRYTYAWLKLHMEGNTTYAEVFAGDEDAAKFSRFEYEP